MEGTGQPLAPGRGGQDNKMNLLHGSEAVRQRWGGSALSDRETTAAPNSFYCLIDEVVAVATGRATGKGLSSAGRRALKQVRELSPEEVATHLGPALASLTEALVGLLARSQAEQAAAGGGPEVMDRFLGRFLDLLQDLHSRDAVDALLGSELGQVIAKAAPELAQRQDRVGTVG